MSNISLKIWKWFHGNFKLIRNLECKMKKIDIKYKFQVLGSSKVPFGFIILISLEDFNSRDFKDKSQGRLVNTH
jgi:hypothetical protein